VPSPAIAEQQLADSLRANSNRPAFGIGFLTPDEPETDTSAEALGRTIPNPARSPEETADAGAEPASDFDELPDQPNESPAGTSSRASTRASNPLVGDGLRDMARNGIIIASHQVHTYVGSRTPGQRAVELYRADDEDAASIGDPLARIAGRRDGVGEMSPDTADLMAAMMGLAGYAAKQIQKNATAQKIDARTAGGAADVQPMPTPDDLAGDLA
jgi:hypothetical protein